jgi:hypothetical protein
VPRNRVGCQFKGGGNIGPRMHSIKVTQILLKSIDYFT